MREEESSSERNWFAQWEDQLPSPEELMPLSQSLITPDLALAFDIINNNSNSNTTPSSSHHHQPPNSDLGVSHSATTPGAADEQARTLKRPRLVWTPQLHKRFVDAVAHLGIKNAVPKTIMQLMSVDGLTRENVASHLQKYRLYLKRMQGLSSAGGGGASISAADDQLFASGPIPHHFLNGGRGGGIGPPPIPPGHGADQAFVPFVPMAAALQQHHQQQMAAAVAAAQQQFYGQRQMGQQQPFDHGGFLPRVQPHPLQPGLHRMGSNAAGLNGTGVQVQPVGDDDSEERGGGGGRKVLTLFPTGED